MRGLPNVFAVGYVGRDAVFHKITESGGFINFSIYCIRKDAKDGDPNPACYYNVKHWVKTESRLANFLVKGVAVSVTGYWEVSKSKDVYYNTLVANDIQLIQSAKEKAQAPASETAS